jgi:hypothetical protein
MNLSPNASPAPASERIPFPPEQPKPSAKRNKWLYIGIGGAIVVGGCCILIVVALVLSGVLNRKPAPAATSQPGIIPTEPSLPPVNTSVPASQPTVTIQAENVPAPTPRASGGSTSPFSDNFSDGTSGWAVSSTDIFEVSYNTSGFYEMAVKKANSFAVSKSPDNFPKPIANMILKVRAQPGFGNTGDYGVVCRYQDIDNFYMAGITGKQFFIGKLINGEWTYLTSPDIQPLPSLTPDAYGYNIIAMSCIDSFIVLEVNGIGAAHITDDALSTGDVGLVVWAGETADKFGYYAHAGFDDFSAELPAQ